MSYRIIFVVKSKNKNKQIKGFPQEKAINFNIN